MYRVVCVAKAVLRAASQNGLTLSNIFASSNKAMREGPKTVLPRLIHFTFWSAGNINFGLPRASGASAAAH